MTHELEVIAAEPPPANLLDERQPALDCACFTATALTPSSSAACTLVSQSCSVSGALDQPLRCLGGFFGCWDRSSRSARSFNTWSRSSDALPMRPREVSSPFATSFPISETWQPSSSAACGWVIHSVTSAGYVARVERCLAAMRGPTGPILAAQASGDEYDYTFSTAVTHIPKLVRASGDPKHPRCWNSFKQVPSQ